MKRLLILLLSVFSLTAFSQTETKRIAILETVDKEGNVDYPKELLLRQTLTFAIQRTSGYEGFNRVDVSAITGEQNFQRTGMVSDEQIKQLGQMTGAKYILIAEAANYSNTEILVLANLVDVESGKIVNSSIPIVTSMDSETLTKSCIDIAKTLLNIGDGTMPTRTTTTTTYSQTGMHISQQITDFVINKRLLQERGFRFPKSQDEAIATLRTSHGEVNIVCLSHDASDFDGARCYGATFDEDSGLNGLAIINTGYEWIMCYIVSSSIVYPYMRFRTDNEDGNHYFVGIQERTYSYGCAYHPNWDSSDDRNVCPCMQEIFGKNVTTINFIQEVVNKEFYLPELQKSFEDFLRNGGVFDCSWSDDED